MSKQTINTGSSANDGTGDKIRVAFQKSNNNFNELYDSVVPLNLISSDAGNSIVIGTDDKLWSDSGSSTPDATEIVKGKIRIATEVERVAGSDDLTAITPLKLATSVNEVYDSITGSLSPVATSNDYNDLGNLPNLSLKEDTANKSTSTADFASSVKFPVWSAIISYFSTSKIKTILGQASSSIDGYLSTTDWNVFNNKQDVPIARTGASITFDKTAIYNTFTTPTSSTITSDLTGAKIGVIQKIYCNASSFTEPTGWKKQGTGTFTNSQKNIIYATWCESARVEYWIELATV